MTTPVRRLLVASLCVAPALLAAPARAQNPDPMDIRACTAIESDAQRLACYDRATGRVNLPVAKKRPDDMAMFARDTDKGTEGHDHGPAGAPLSLLDSRWELSPEAKLGTFNIRGYKPVYVMPVFATSNQNERPTSPNPLNTVQNPQQLQNAEAKFQLSLKTKVAQDVFGDAGGDVWVGYTQSSRWQVYNNDTSRPFRETNYEPEAMLVFDTHYDVLGWQGRLLGIGVDHQSNGRSNPLSRSWNRVIADVGFERGDWTIMLRPWWRIPEHGSDDNNPDISDYMGRAEAQIVHEWNGQEFGLMLRHSLRGGSASHGAAQFTWSFPIAGNLRGYTELFKGYGESLIDYNHNATYLGVGESLLDWY
jgi:phospholipase A1